MTIFDGATCANDAQVAVCKDLLHIATDKCLSIPLSIATWAPSSFLGKPLGFQPNSNSPMQYRQNQFFLSCGWISPIEHVRINIGAIIPTYRVGFVINMDCPKIGRVLADGFEDGSPEQGQQIHRFLFTIRKVQKNLKIIKRFYIFD
jgi:hypothetical protein